MQEIKRVGVLSVAKFTAAIFAIVGLVFGILLALVGNLISQLIADLLSGVAQTASTSNPLSGLAVFLWIGAFTLAPLMFAIFGFIIGVIGAWIYNLIAKTGGLKADIRENIAIQQASNALA
jgi:hypothetical protein